MSPDIKPSSDVSPEQEAQDVLDFLDRFHTELPRFSDEVMAQPDGAVGSIEWAIDTARYWRGMREDLGLSRYRVAGVLGVHVNELRLFETGIKHDWMIGEFPLRYAQALGSTDLYEQFCQQFGVQPFTPPQTS